MSSPFFPTKQNKNSEKTNLQTSFTWARLAGLQGAIGRLAGRKLSHLPWRIGTSEGIRGLLVDPSPWVVCDFFRVGGREGWMKNMPLYKEKRCGVWLKCEGKMVMTWSLDGFLRSCFIFFERFLNGSIELVARSCLHFVRSDVIIFPTSSLLKHAWNDVFHRFSPYWKKTVLPFVHTSPISLVVFPNSQFPCDQPFPVAPSPFPRRMEFWIGAFLTRCISWAMSPWHNSLDEENPGHLWICCWDGTRFETIQGWKGWEGL